MKKMMKDFQYFIKMAYRLDKLYFIYFFLDSFFKCIAPFAMVIFPKYILNEIMLQRRVSYIIGYLSAMAIIDIIINLAVQITEPKVNNRIQHLRAKMSIDFSRHVLNMDYEHMENAQLMDLKQKAIEFVYGGDGLESVTFNAGNVLVSFGRMIGYGAIILSCNPLIIGIIILCSFLSARLHGRAEQYSYEAEMEIVRPNRQASYLDFICSDYSHGKDIRFYNIKEWILEKRKKYNDIRLGAFNKVCKRFVHLGVKTTLLNNSLNICYYLYLIYLLFKEKILIGNFTMYLASITNFSQAVSNLFVYYARFLKVDLRLSNYIEFMSVKSKLHEGATRHIEDTQYEIQFENVSFCYPGSDAYALKNISVTIQPRKKIAVVGQNGAGKTTFIKLLLRLYDPTEGRITINGIDIRELDYEEYMRCFAVVFQDYHLFAFSMKENVAFKRAGEVADEEIEELLVKVGLEEKLKKLPKGIYTGLSKQFDDDGTDVSGGESQKIAIARAVYKDAAIIILDEPTSALDPLAEYEIYKSYDSMVEGKTSIFISHRMASTRLADQIMVFANGELTEHGTHSELMEKEGMYREMFQMQAQYYMD